MHYNLLNANTIYLRPVEPSDANTMLLWENNPENWRVSGTEAPFSLHGILEYINSIQNFRSSGELRLIICKNETNMPIGTLDLFEANFKHGRAGIGILIADKNERNKGFASEALEIIKRYANDVLEFYNLTANVLENNESSIALFETAGFELVGVRKNWFYERGKRINERIYQICLKK